MKCEICNKEVNGTKGLSVHLSKNHKFEKEEIKEYYDKYLKKKDEGNCYFCNSPAIFFNITRGYHKICDSKECLGKTRATGTSEFLMYKHNLNKEESLKEQSTRATKRGEKIKISLDEKLKENSNFHKEKSHQTKEYWLKRGFSEEESLMKSMDVMKDIHIKTKEKRENKENYKDVNNNQIGYWLKRGFNEDESRKIISERQKTFSLEKCIEKYGEIEGTKVWLDRQEKWINSYKKSNFSKISQNLFWKIYEKIEEKNEIYFATLKDGNLDDSGKNNEKKLRLDKIVLSPDFLNKNKIIEFDGTYYHRTNPENKKREKNRDEELINNGYEILHIKESDYTKNKEEIIEKCLNFLKK